mgnify:CR=1 FL=1
MENLDGCCVGSHSRESWFDFSSMEVMMAHRPASAVHHTYGEWLL